MLASVIAAASFTFPFLAAHTTGTRPPAPPLLAELTRFGRDPLPGAGFRSVPWKELTLVVPESIQVRPGPRLVVPNLQTTELWLVSPRPLRSVSLRVATRARQIEIGIDSGLEMLGIVARSSRVTHVRSVLAPSARDLGRFYPRRELYYRLEITVGASDSASNVPIIVVPEGVETER